MDATNSFQPDSGTGRIFNETLSEKVPSGFESSTLHSNHLTVDTQAGALRNAHADSPATAPRTPDRQPHAEPAKSQHFTLRTLPPWIRSVEAAADDGEEAQASDRLLPSEPNDARVAQHNYAPHITSRQEYSLWGERALFDGSRTPSQARESRWKTFSRTIQYPRGSEGEIKEVTPEWMNDNLGDYSGLWRGNLLEGDSPEYPLHNHGRREIWFKRFHSQLLRSPIVPLILRMTVWSFSLSALALGGSIQHMASKGDRSEGPSALMAIIVDAVALVYLLYITFDEYTSKPLGLRSPSAKARLILLDLFFIVFDSANLSLAFDSLSNVTGSCTEADINSKINPQNNAICGRQKALASVLLIALLGWLMTFALSVLRLVERVQR
ncbi:hypothetical protein N7448_007777 [Penicillium atrosanguineum]|uniref:Regulator of phospholipase D SRF1 n=1 Tax=Penicillium atrosanguineum TaxID=1132637 RepID=A0A9W9QD37_9EURO|nr:uncharacterized protein N7443_001202 [Penicillium atrosanguineum]KAJ5126998.1 hypothetical protein N7448_007777 [Penicillium atrosanguineum]KAJ5147203.1 hypothetical protein N7526_000555 [Penicillium atrosanguineum]KAJ5314318.1 hypothetical protein N7443_001202 [Penicillium atrosanguineum]KAJ5331485.1 hypothetical protein N7476_001268 [Penicillium atrosanguineum]